MASLNGIKNTSKCFYYFYKELRQSKKIHAQKNATSQIYNDIIKRVPIKEIEKNCPVTLSREICAILRKLKQTGYVQLPPLNQEATISVVIPHFEHYHYLDEALLNLSNQTCRPEEIIIVDDQSKDKNSLKKIIKKYESSLPIKLIFPEKKAYAGGCRQIGAENSKSDIIVMHDADDISHENRIELTKYFFHKHKDAVHLNCGLVSFKEKLFQYLKNFTKEHVDSNTIDTKKITGTMKKMFTNQSFSVHDQVPVRGGCYGHPGNYSWECHAGHVAYRRDVADIIKWTTPSDYLFTQYEDYEFNLLLFLACQQSYQIDLPLIYYRLESSTHHLKLPQN